MDWKVLDTGVSSPEENMATDYALLQNLESTSLPILHFYEWDSPSATYGHFIKPLDHLNESGVVQYGLKLAKRPTGGGLLFHLTDFTYSIVVPEHHPAFSINTLENYAFVNCIIANVVGQFLKDGEAKEEKGKDWKEGRGGEKGKNREWCEEGELLAFDPPVSYPQAAHFCLAKPTIYDVMWQGKKIGGAAQRRTKKGYLHQGTISLAPLSLKFLYDVVKDPGVVAEMMNQSHYLLCLHHLHHLQLLHHSSKTNNGATNGAANGATIDQEGIWEVEISKEKIFEARKRLKKLIIECFSNLL